jgi:FlaA1/EpsC-like NDP-sugar epimerase
VARSCNLLICTFLSKAPPLLFAGVSGYGLEPDKDVPIVYTGLRPGEKLFEEILTAEEGTTVTLSKKIFIANDRNHFGREHIEDVKELIREAERGAPRELLIHRLKDLVPTYRVDLTETGLRRIRKLKSTAAR